MCSVEGLFVAYPDLVNDAMVRKLGRDSTAHIACVTWCGLPQPLIDRFTGRRVAFIDPCTAKPWD
jgi:hypothetical protein